MKLDIGGGPAQDNSSWTTINIDPALHPDVVADAKNLSSFKDNSADEIFASHILEHFSQRDTLTVLKEWYRILKPRGKITIYVPNPIEAFQRWQKGHCTDSWLITVIFGYDPDETSYQAHKCMFWPENLRGALQKIGFLNIELLPSRGGLRGAWEEFGCSAIKSM